MRRIARFVASAVVATAIMTAAQGPVRPWHAPRIHKTFALHVTGRSSAIAGPAPKVACSPRSSSEANQPDIAPAAQIQVIYFVPQGKPDQCLDNFELINAMKALNEFYTTQGLGAMHLDKTSTGAIDIPFVRGNSNESAYNGVAELSAELSQRGYISGIKRYIIFSADNQGAVCGEAEWPGRYAAFFLDSDVGCGVRDFGNGTVAGSGQAEVVAGHEILHNEGAVDLLAPHGCQVALLHYGHVCTPGGLLVELGNVDPESRDILFPYATGLKLSQKTLDVGHDDYFKVTAAYAPLITDIDGSAYFG